MTNFKIKTKKFSIKQGASVDDVADMVRMIMSLPMSLERIVIENDIRADFWIQDAEPPFGELPEEQSRTYQQVLGNVEAFEVDTSSVELNLDALAVITTMLIEANKRRRAALAWLVGDPVFFCEWLKVTPTPSRFLELPIVKVDSLSEDKLVLLCGKSYACDPMTADEALIVTMGVEGKNVL